MKRVAIVGLIAALVSFMFLTISVLAFEVDEGESTIFGWLTAISSTTSHGPGERIPLDDTAEHNGVGLVGIRIEAVGTDVVIYESAGDTVTADLSGDLIWRESFSPGAGMTGITVEQKAESLILKTEVDNENEDPSYSSNAVLKVSLPRLFTGSLTFNNVSGDISLETNLTVSTLRVNTVSGDFNSSELTATVVHLNSVSGDVRAATISSDTISINSVSGDIQVTKLLSQTTTTNTTSGDVRIQNASGAVNHDSSSGDLELGLVPPDGRVGVDTSSGDVTIRVSDRRSATLDVETSSGDIRVLSPVEVTSTHSSRLMGSTGDSVDKPLMGISTSSGDVTIRPF